MNRYILPAALIAAIAVLGGGYALYAHYHNPGASDVVRKFYFMWTDSSIHPLVERSYRGSPYLTHEFQRRLDRQGRGFEKTGFDPVVCGKEVPEDFHVSFVQGDSVKPTLQVSMEARNGTPQKPQVTVLKQSNGTWLIDSVTCPGTEEALQPTASGATR